MRFCTVLLIAIAGALATCGAAAAGNITSLASVGAETLPVNDAVVSPDGQSVVFSTSEPLDAQDIDGQDDVYRRAGGVTTLVTTLPPGSVDYQLIGTAANNSRVFFRTTGDLLPEDNDNLVSTDIYMQEGSTITLISTSADDPGNAESVFAGASADGDKVFFTSVDPLTSDDDDTLDVDVYERDVTNSTTRLVSTSGSASDTNDLPVTFCGVSASGAVVSFATQSPLVLEDADAGTRDVYSRANGTTTELVSTLSAADLTQAVDSNCGGVSSDGTAVAFVSKIVPASPVDPDTTKDDVFVRKSGQTRWVSRSDSELDGNSNAFYADMSANGDTVYFLAGSKLDAADTDGSRDGYAQAADLSVSLLTGGSLELTQGDATLKGVSDDGSRVLFQTSDQFVASDLDSNEPDLYLKVNGGAAELISTGPVDQNDSLQPHPLTDSSSAWPRTTMSDDGTVIGFYTQAKLTADDQDVALDDIYLSEPAPPAATPDTPPAPPAAPDTVAPAISSAKLSEKKFPAKGKKRGTKVSFNASEAGSVAIDITQSSTGRKSGSKCVKQTSKNKSAKKCTLTKTLTTLKSIGIAGSNSVSFSGKVKGKALKPGKYKAVIVVTDAAQNSSAPKSLSFTITKS